MRSDAGAILIHAAVSLVGLVACTAFVTDYGMQLVSRNQAQTAADAGALAGAGALALGGGCAVADAATARRTALNVALRNGVWGEAPAATLADVTTELCPDGRANCVKVSVYRDAGHGNPIPTMFAQLLGSASVGVAATATGEWLPATATDCLRPLAIPDRWTDSAGGWTPVRTYDRAAAVGPPNPDNYVAPSAGGAGTGLTVGAFCSTEVRLTPADPSQKIRPWQFVPLDLVRADRFLNPGGDTLHKNLTRCNALESVVGDGVPLARGNVRDSIRDGIEDLMDLDPDASWDAVRQRVRGGCMASGACVVSPRIVAVALFDPDAYEIQRLQNGRVSGVTIRNIAGLFVSGRSGDDVRGYLTLYPGLANSARTLSADAGFLKSAFLVR